MSKQDQIQVLIDEVNDDDFDPYCDYRGFDIALVVGEIVRLRKVNADARRPDSPAPPTKTNPPQLKTRPV